MTVHALIGKSFRRGPELAFARAMIGRASRPMGEVRLGARLLGHAVLRGCWAGVVGAAGRFGRALGSLDRSHGSLRSSGTPRSGATRLPGSRLPDR